MLIRIGDRVMMRKPHACGGNDWEVTRTGADIGMKCLKCGHKVMLTREKFERALKTLRESTAENVESAEGLEDGCQPDNR